MREALPIQADFLLRRVGEAAANGGATIGEFVAATGVHGDGPASEARRPYPRCVYQPMVELLRYLEDNDFTNYIVSGGGRDFLRVISEPCYGIPPEHVIGGAETPAQELLDDGPMKPVAIWTPSGGVRSWRPATRTATSRCCASAPSPGTRP